MIIPSLVNILCDLFVTEHIRQQFSSQTRISFHWRQTEIREILFGLFIILNLFWLATCQFILRRFLKHWNCWSINVLLGKERHTFNITQTRTHWHIHSVYPSLPTVLRFSFCKTLDSQPQDLTKKPGTKYIKNQIYSTALRGRLHPNAASLDFWKICIPFNCSK